MTTGSRSWTRRGGVDCARGGAPVWAAWGLGAGKRHSTLGFSGVGMGQRSTAGGRERGREYSLRPWASNNLLGLLLTGPIKYGLYFMIDPAFNHSLLFFVNKTSLSLPRY